MLMPKRVKRRKQFRGSMAGKANRGTTITYGEYGIVATEPCWIKSNQIEAARIAMTRYIKLVARYSLRFSQISQYPQSRLRLVWVPERVLLSIG